jgi:L-malate glycosyltransferase
LKKVLICSHEYPPRLGGAGGVAQQLANFYFKNGFDVTVLTKKQNLKVDDEQFKRLEVKIYGKLWFIFYPIFFLFHNFKQYDLIILNDSAVIYSAGLTFSKDTFSKTLVYNHGVEKHIVNFEFFHYLIGFKYFFLKSLENCKKIISVSDFIKEKFFTKERAYLKDKVEVVYNGVDTNHFFYIKSDLKHNLGISEEKIVLLTVGRFTKKKGYDTKLAIFEKLLKINSNYIWVIIGDGDYKNIFSQSIKIKNLEENTLILGAKSKNELKYYYSISDFFWLLSDYEEAFPLVYFEAMACKSIPIGWNKAGVREVINNEYGLLANSENQVIDFIINDFKHIDKDLLPQKVINMNDAYKRLLELM